MAGEDKVALMTGASAGIGRAVAIAFLKEGYKVVLAGRRSDALAESIALSGAPTENALAHACDLTDPVAVKGCLLYTSPSPRDRG